MNEHESTQTLAQVQARLGALERRIQVEEALERVRVRAMAMRRSDELAETAVVVFQELEKLGIAPRRCGFAIKHADGPVWQFWHTTKDGRAIAKEGSLSEQHIPFFQEAFEAWRQRARASLTCTFAGDDLDKVIHFLIERTEVNLPDAETEVQQGLYPEQICFNFFFFTHGSLLAHTLKPLRADDRAVLERFAQVFDLTYRRFLDLKRAEAQAREAQIEAALERVRARSMAMHHSRELSEVIAVVFERFHDLEFEADSCAIQIIEEETRDLQVWMSNINRTHIFLLFPSSFWNFEHPVVTRLLEALEEETFFTNTFTRQEKNSYFAWLYEHTSFKQVPEERKAYLMDSPGMTWSVAMTKPGSLVIYKYDGEPFSEEENDILRRFARVFEQTYTRFLDLKKAEEQAREAQIEAALERVRAKAMGMHHSDELCEVVGTVFEALKDLDIDSSLCSIGIYDQETRGSDWWISDASQGGLPRSYHMPFLDGPWFKSVFEAWQQQVPFHVFELSGDPKIEQDRFSFEHTDLKFLPESTKEMLRAQDRFKASYISMAHGMLEVATEEELSDEHVEILSRFARVIDLTYTRFDELQQAEARAREAVRQASLDRVRAEIASMRTADDLQRITPLLWRELTTLGVPFFRCGVFIMDEDARHIQTYLANPQGETLATLRIPYESAETTSEIVAYWRRQQVYTERWSRLQFVDWMQTMQEQGLLASTERYQGAAAPPEQLALQFVPFTQGMLYVGSAAPLAEDQIDLVQALADAFSVAYARYEDFTRLEAAKAEIESTLADLKATQAQLVQAEKMASLGRLTAGIAHEIKNPLNFVNNFAQLTAELVEELNEDILANADKTVAEVTPDFTEILTDLKLNASKINAHGQRADGIVRAMMQHVRGGEVERRPTGVNDLLEEYVALAYHGMRAATPDFNAAIERSYDEAVGEIKLVPQEMGRVFINVLNNAFYAVHEKAKAEREGSYMPTVSISTRHSSEMVEIRIADNGPGISKAFREKIFEPFFTTKPTGSGTGLGLSLSYDIVTQGHGGTMTVESAEGDGATFIITLPV